MAYGPEHDYWKVENGEVVRRYGPDTWRYRLDSASNKLEVLYTCIWDNAKERDSRRWEPESGGEQVREARARLAQAAKQSAGGKMITLVQLNEIPRPSWLSAYVDGMAEFCSDLHAESRDLRSKGGAPAITVFYTAKNFLGAPWLEIYPAGTTLDEKIEFLQHAKAVAALLKSPKVQFRR